MATTLKDLAIGTVARRVIKETKMRGGERPETLGKASTNKTGTHSLEYVEVGPFDHSVILRDSWQRQLMNNAEILTSKLGLGSVIRVKDLNLLVTKELSLDTLGLLPSFIENWEEGLDLGKQALNNNGVTVSCDTLHTSVLGDQMVSGNKLKPFSRLSAPLIRATKLLVPRILPRLQESQYL